MKRKHLDVFCQRAVLCFETANGTLTKIRNMYFLQAAVSLLVVFALQNFAEGNQSELFLYFDSCVEIGGCE